MMTMTTMMMMGARSEQRLQQRLPQEGVWGVHSGTSARIMLSTVSLHVALIWARHVSGSYSVLRLCLDYRFMHQKDPWNVPVYSIDMCSVLPIHPTEAYVCRVECGTRTCIYAAWMY